MPTRTIDSSDTHCKAGTFHNRDVSKIPKRHVSSITFRGSLRHLIFSCPVFALRYCLSEAYWTGETKFEAWSESLWTACLSRDNPSHP
jgi:hypothetical protein